MGEGTEFEVLGPVRLRGADGMVEPGGRLQRILLGVLLARANEPVSVDVLADALWRGEPTPRAAQKLQVHVHKLRRALDDPGRLSFGPSGYRLLVRPGELDADRFTTLVDTAAELAGNDPARCADLLRDALSHFRGTPYDGLDVPLLADEADRLAERRLAALDLRFAAELDRGGHAAVVPELSALVAAHPLRERLVGLLVTALHRTGRQAEALAVYRRTRRRLVDELGLEPGAALRAVEQQVLSGEADAPAAGPVRPAQLPPNVREFVGRDTELSELDTVLAGAQETPATAVVVGTAGVGKTALVLRWAHQVRDRFPDGQLYVDLRGYGPEDPMPPEDALAGFLRALGVGGNGVPQTLAERSARLRSLVDGRQMLVLLDNARTVEQVRPLLAGTPTVVAVVTSRDMLAGLVARDGAERVVLDRLPEAESVTLLRTLAGGRRDIADDEAAALAQQCARLPLALRVAAELVRVRPAVSVAELLAELADENRRLDVFGAEFGDGDPHSSVRAVLSWSYRHLPADAARLFRLCGLHPGRDLEVHALAALTGADPRTVGQWLRTLVRAHLVEETAGNRVRLHDLLSAYAAELVHTTDRATDRDAALTRLFDYYVATAAQATEIMLPQQSEYGALTPTTSRDMPALIARPDAVGWLDAERANLVAVAELAADRGAARYTTALSTVLWRYLDDGLYLDDSHRLHTSALAMARAEGDRATEGIALRGLGLGHHRADRYEQAAQHLTQAVTLHEQVSDRLLLATSLNFLAGTHFMLGSSQDALDEVQRAIRLYDEVGAEALRGNALSNLGLVYERLGRHDEAFSCLTAALTVVRESDSPGARARILRQLAQLCHAVGRDDEALDHAHAALTLTREIGFRRASGSLHVTLGRVYARRGDHDQAAHHLRAALTFAEAHGTNQLTAQTFVAMGTIELAAGVPDRAGAYYTEALAAAERGGVRYEQALAHAGLGDVHDLNAEHGAATGHWRRARDLFREIGAPQAADLDGKLSAPRSA